MTEREPLTRSAFESATNSVLGAFLGSCGFTQTPQPPGDRLERVHVAIFEADLQRAAKASPRWFADVDVEADRVALAIRWRRHVLSADIEGFTLATVAAPDPASDPGAGLRFALAELGTQLAMLLRR